jgi:hypothetical protein
MSVSLLTILTVIFLRRRSMLPDVSKKFGYRTYGNGEKYDIFNILRSVVQNRLVLKFLFLENP